MNVAQVMETCQLGDQDMKPTRLIKIDGGQVCLYPTAEYKDCLKHATLSHCWGGPGIYSASSTQFFGVPGGDPV